MVAATIAPASAPVALVATALAVPTSTAEATVVTTRHSGGVRAQRRATARESKRPRVPPRSRGSPVSRPPSTRRHAPRISGVASASN